MLSPLSRSKASFKLRYALLRALSFEISEDDFLRPVYADVLRTPECYSKGEDAQFQP